VFSAGIFHLFTHAFFKALLFLGAGSVIHAMHHEQDMRRMGGLRKKIPITYAMMLIGSLALTGVGIPGTEIGFAGFQSKDAIVEAAYGLGGDAGMFSFWLLVLAAAFTSFYSWRLLFMTFHGQPRSGAGEHGAPQEPGDAETHAAVAVHPDHGHAVHADHDHADHGHAGHSAYDHAHESPNVMLIPLYVLAAGATLAGMVFLNLFMGDPAQVQHFFAGALVVAPEALEAAHQTGFWVKTAPFIAMLAGFIVAWEMYIRNPALPAALARRNWGLYQFLLNKWYFDELYDRIFVRPALWIGRQLWHGFDDELVDQTLTEGLGRRVRDVTAQVVKLQSGYLYHYAFVMLIGIALLLTWAIAAGGLLG
jgi:NADH-quinone oxidoreductase subunit L